MYKTFVCYFIAMLILGLVAPIEAQNPMVDIIRDAITDPNCEAACFLGIQPGITSVDELVAILEANNLQYHKNQLPDTMGYSYIVDWHQNDPLFPFIDDVVSFDITPSYFTQYSYDVVEGINFFIKGISLSDMLTLFPNPPDRIITIFTPVFLYVDEGVGYYINTVSNIEAVYGLLLISPQDLEVLLFMNDDIRPCVEPAALCNIPGASFIRDFTIADTSIGDVRLGEPSDVPYEANMEITAQTYPEQVGSVVFSDGSMTIIDDTAPYSWVVPEPGSYLLKARPYSEPGGQGTAGTPLSILFNVAGLPSGCDYAVRSVSRLISSISQANAAGIPQTICLNGYGIYIFSQSSGWFFGDTALPPITGNITIKGNGATIARPIATPYFRLFGVDGTGTLRLENLTLNGGSLNENAGGAIANFGGTVVLDDVTLENHQALSTSDGSGGAIYNYFGTLTLTNSQLVNNTAAVAAGGIYNWGGSVTVSNTCIVGNTAPDGLAIKEFDTATTTAANNWWGATDGPGGAGSGTGDGVGANITYTPWLTSQAAPCADIAK